MDESKQNGDDFEPRFWSSGRFTVLKQAITVRALLTLLLLAGSCLNEDFDSSSELVLDTGSPLGRLVKPFLRWDALYFAKIAASGYTLEQEYAFFPMYPIIVHYLHRSRKKTPKVGLASVSESGTFAPTIIGVGVILSFVLNVCTSLLVYSLTLHFACDRRVAQHAALAFSLCPGSVFLSSFYADALYPFLCYKGLELFYVRNNQLAAAFYWGIGSYCRANGLLMGGLIVWKLLQNFRRLRMANVVASSLSLALVAAPFLEFQWRAYRQFCTAANLNPIPPWCQYGLPFVYPYVQQKYWNVGFLRYFNLLQLPNLLLGLPVYAIVALAVFDYVRELRTAASTRGEYLWGIDVSKPATPGQRSLPAVYLLMVIFSLQILLFAHSQIILRQISSQLPFFIYAGKCMATGKNSKFVLYTLLMYNVLLTLTFASFYPPA